MSEGLAVWPVLFLLGAYHGMNPGMGWLFAVARGMQEHRTRAVPWLLPPIALGHALSIGVAVLIAGLAQVVLPLMYIRIAVAAALVGMGVYKLIRSRHFRWGGMQVGFRELSIWSFLMASAHGAGLMVVPVVLAGPHAHHHLASQGASGVLATLWLPGPFANIRPVRLHLLSQVLCFHRLHFVANCSEVLRKFCLGASNSSRCGVNEVRVACIFADDAAANARLCVAAVVAAALGHVEMKKERRR